MNVTFFAVNGVGLGHVNRCAVLAGAMKEKTFIATNSAQTDLIKDFKHVSIPFKASYASYGKGSQEAPEFCKLVDAIGIFGPDIAVFDTLLFERFFDNERILKAKNIMVLRRQDDAGMRELLSKIHFDAFDTIILPHTDEEFDSASPDIRHAIRLDGRFIFTGPIRKDMPAENLHKRFTVVITAGGGGHDENNPGPERFFRTVRTALAKADIAADIRIITGPHYTKDPGFPKGKVTIFDPKLPQTIANADLVIGTGGYNLCNEIAATSTPAIILPLERAKESQQDRVQYFVEKYGFKTADTVDQLARVIRELRTEHTRRQKIMTLNGTKTAVDAILKRPKSPQRIWTGNTCNNACRQCIARRRPIRKERIADMFIMRRQSESLMFYGGEPMLNPNLAFYVKIAKEKGIDDLRITTNGRIFKTKAACDKAQKLGIRTFRIYRFGKTAEEHDAYTGMIGSYKQTHEGISMLRSRDCIVEVIDL